MLRPLVKICGITKTEQAIEISEMGVDALGFVLHKGSKRYIDPEKLQEIIKPLPPYLKTVGVFVNEDPENLIKIMRQTALDLAQLHGDEDEKYCAYLTKNAINWVKALRVKDKPNLKGLKQYNCSHFHLDAFSKGVYGGSGETFDWELAKEISEKYKIILSGGLNENNIKDAVKKLKPYAVDISSGVEIKPGIKSIEKIKTLLACLND